MRNEEGERRLKHMTNRDTNLLAMRPDIPTAQPELAANPIEQFQHATLRPILKGQNDLLISAFLHYTERRKGVFQKLSPDKKAAYIEQALQKDQRFREWMFGLLAGHFTTEEWAFYLDHEPEIRKRITSMLVQRLVDQLS